MSLIGIGGENKYMWKWVKLIFKHLAEAFEHQDIMSLMLFLP